MKILKSYRDGYFQKWNEEDWVHGREERPHTRFGYIPVEQMQRGDATIQSQTWRTEHHIENARLIKLLRESMPKEGMFSPLILVVTKHPHWRSHREQGHNRLWASIPFTIYTGNNRYQVAKENGYTHISSIMLGVSINYRVFNYLQAELKRPLSDKIEVSRELLREKL